MQRTGIPASIKMAQALLESGAGSSTLARKANNHFGIKCGGGWDGETFYREDDDYHKGRLIKSCFRKFDTVLDSYMEHSNFLMDQPRYEFLFDYPVSDYKSWAKGLRKAGYATDKSYSHKLIDLIEKYELYKLDQLHVPDSDIEVLADSDDGFYRSRSSGSLGNEIVTEREEASHSTGRTKSVAFYTNATSHVVSAGESLSDIARLYGLEETALRLRNRLPKDAEPLEGEEINLRKKISLLNRPKFERNADVAMADTDDDFIF